MPELIILKTGRSNKVQWSSTVSNIVSCGDVRLSFGEMIIVFKQDSRILLVSNSFLDFALNERWNRWFHRPFSEVRLSCLLRGGFWSALSQFHWTWRPFWVSHWQFCERKYVVTICSSHHFVVITLIVRERWTWANIWIPQLHQSIYWESWFYHHLGTDCSFRGGSIWPIIAWNDTILSS